jgi:hypothetical protein
MDRSPAGHPLETERACATTEAKPFASLSLQQRASERISAGTIASSCGNLDGLTRQRLCNFAHSRARCRRIDQPVVSTRIVLRGIRNENGQLFQGSGRSSFQMSPRGRESMSWPCQLVSAPWGLQSGVMTNVSYWPATLIRRAGIMND